MTFDVFSSRSEAVHVNLVGYITASDHKAADLYAWLGNGGARDYTSFEGNTVYLYNVATAQATPVGMVTFWKPSGSDVFWYNLTRSPVWNADFTSFTPPGGGAAVPLDAFVNLSFNGLCTGAPTSADTPQLFDGSDSSHRVFLGPVTKPLWASSIFDRTRVIVLQHDVSHPQSALWPARACRAACPYFC